MMSRSKRKNYPKDHLLYLCPLAATVKENKFSGLKYKFIILKFWRSEVQYDS